jgi:hypothetical protein
MRILTSLFLCLCLSLTFNTHAQISIGIKAGPDFGKLVNAVEGNDGSGGISTLSSGTLTQVYGGLFLDIPLDSGKMFYLRPGIEYVGAGGKMSPSSNFYNANGFMANTKYELHYVDVPLEFLFSPSLGSVRPWIGLGLYAGALVNGTIKPQDGSSEPVMVGSKAEDNFSRVDFGYTFTLGMATNVGFLFGTDYQHGLVRVVPDGTDQTMTRLKTHNSVWGLHLGWVVKL